MPNKVYISTNNPALNAAYIKTIERALFSINEVSISILSADSLPDPSQHMATVKPLIDPCDLFIGVYAQQAASEGMDKAEAEYHYAASHDKMILIYIQKDALDHLSEREESFLKHLQQNHIIQYFDDMTELEMKVKLDLDRYQKTSATRKITRGLQSFLGDSKKIGESISTSVGSIKIFKEEQQQQVTEEDNRSFEEMVNDAVTIASQDLEQLITRSLELHEARRQVSSKQRPPADYDGKIEVKPLWGEPMRQSQFKSDIFMVMPFREHFAAVYEGVIKPTAAQLNMTIKRGDDFSSIQGSIIQDVWAALNGCQLVIAETSEVNANVYYELGIAHTLGKPVILITQTTEVELLPFDIRHLRFVVYENSPEGMEKFSKELNKAILWLMNDINDINSRQA